jgi:hypothetical protein
VNRASPPIRIWIWRLAFVAVAALVARALWQIRPGSEHFWDFRVYYLAPKAWLAGLDPYRAEPLQLLCSCTLPIAYVYPPLTLWLFRPLAALPEAVAFHLHLAVLLASGAGLFVLWRRRLGIGSPLALMLFLFWFGFNGAGATALYAGNLVMVEVLLSWMALDAFVRQRYPTAAALLALVSVFKISPAMLFVPLSALVLRERRGQAALGFMAAFCAVFPLQWLAMPELFQSWLDAIRATDWERGAIHPSSFAFISDLSGSARYAVYGAFVTAVTAALFMSLRGRLDALLAGAEGRRELAMLAAATFAILAPRFKDYSYIFLIAPLLHAARKVPRLAVALFLLCAFSVSGLFEDRLASLGRLRFLAEYQPLFGAWTIFAVLLVTIRREPSPP